MKYVITSATQSLLSGITLIPDGVSSSVTFALNEAPFNLNFGSTFPVATNGLGSLLNVMVNGSTQIVPITVTFDPILFTFTIAFIGATPSAGSQIALGNQTLIYQG